MFDQELDLLFNDFKVLFSGWQHSISNKGDIVTISLKDGNGFYFLNLVISLQSGSLSVASLTKDLDMLHRFTVITEDALNLSKTYQGYIKSISEK